MVCLAWYAWGCGALWRCLIAISAAPCGCCPGGAVGIISGRPQRFSVGSYMQFNTTSEDTKFGDQWGAVVINVQNTKVLLITAYREVGCGPAGSNWDRLQQMAVYIQVARLPFIILADWNMDPETLAKTGWPAFLKAAIVRPGNVAATCSSGKGSLIDYMVC